MLSYSDRYCEECKKWYVPRDIVDLNKCPLCGSEEVHGDE